MKTTVRVRAPKAPTYACVMRLVKQETFHGEFLRLGWVTYDVKTQVIATFEPVNNTFSCETEAASVAEQIVAAMSMPVLELGHHATTKH